MTSDFTINATPILLSAWFVIVASLCIACGDDPAPAKIYETVNVEMVCNEFTCSAVFGQSVRVDGVIAPECRHAAIRYMDASGVLHERPGVILEAVSFSAINLTVDLETGCMGPMTAIVIRRDAGVSG